MFLNQSKNPDFKSSGDEDLAFESAFGKFIAIIEERNERNMNWINDIIKEKCPKLYEKAIFSDNLQLYDWCLIEIMEEMVFMVQKENGAKLTREEEMIIIKNQKEFNTKLYFSFLECGMNSWMQIIGKSRFN